MAHFRWDIRADGAFSVGHTGARALVPTLPIACFMRGNLANYRFLSPPKNGQNRTGRFFFIPKNNSNRRGGLAKRMSPRLPNIFSSLRWDIRTDGAFSVGHTRRWRIFGGTYGRTRPSTHPTIIFISYLCTDALLRVHCGRTLVGYLVADIRTAC